MSSLSYAQGATLACEGNTVSVVVLNYKSVGYVACLLVCDCLVLAGCRKWELAASGCEE